MKKLLPIVAVIWLMDGTGAAKLWPPALPQLPPCRMVTEDNKQPDYNQPDYCKPPRIWRDLKAPDPEH
jgi:hypothetical protein